MPNDIAFDPTNMTILQDVNFDPLAILKGDQKLDPDTPIVKAKEADQNDDDDSGKGDDGASGGKVTKKTPEPAKGPSIELSDDMLQAGLKKASGAVAEDDDDEPTGDGKAPKKNAPAAADDKTNALAVHYKLMTESGEWKPIEGFDGTEEKYLEARQVNAEIQALAITDNWFTEAFKQNPEGLELGKQLFNHLRNGGKVADFVSVVAPAEFKFEDINSDDDTVAEEASKEVIRRYYSAIGWKSDKINTKLANLTKTGQVVDEAKQIEEPYKDLLEIQKKTEFTRVEKAKQARAQQAATINKAITTMLEKNEGFGSIKLWSTPKERKEMEEYIFSPDPETNQTVFNESLNQELRNPRFLMFLATALKYKLYDDPKALGGSGTDDTSKAINTLKGTLEGALLNKNISRNDNTSQIQNQNNSGSKYKFNIDEAVVIS